MQYNEKRFHKTIYFWTNISRIRCYILYGVEGIECQNSRHKANNWKGIFKMASDELVVNDEIYNKEYRRLRTLTSQTDIVAGSVSSNHQKKS